MNEEQIRSLLTKALQATEKSYAPYSKFCVGVALLAQNGEIFCGCNIENSAFSPSVCAERVAIFNAVSNGNKKFKAIAVVGGKNGNCDEFCPPCGVCRQMLAEFCDGDFLIILGKRNLEYKVFTLAQLLPVAFEKNNLD